MEGDFDYPTLERHEKFVLGLVAFLFFLIGVITGYIMGYIGRPTLNECLGEGEVGTEVIEICLVKTK